MRADKAEADETELLRDPRCPRGALFAGGLHIQLRCHLQATFYSNVNCQKAMFTAAPKLSTMESEFPSSRIAARLPGGLDCISIDLRQPF